MQPNIFNTSMKYGFILGIIFSVNFLLSISNNIFLSLLTYVVAVVILVLTYRFSVLYRDNENGGKITYRQAFFFIFMLYLFAAIISSVVKFIYFKYINPDYLSKLIQQSMVAMEQMQNQFNIDIPENALEGVEKIMNPTFYTLQYIWVNTILGGLVGLIMAAFIKKDTGIFDKND